MEVAFLKLKMKIIATNKSASFEYFILQTLEAGIVLNGSEVKSMRFKNVNIKDNFIRIIRGEAFLFNMHIAFLDTVNFHFKPLNTPKKLLLHKREINKLHSLVSTKGHSLIALKLYFNNKNILKVQIALVKGKKLYDKREDLKKKDIYLEEKRNFKIKNLI